MNNEKRLSPAELRRLILPRLAGFSLITGALLFIPAGKFAYWQAWMYLAVLYIPFCFVLVYLLKNAPDLLERRMRMKEKETQQKKIVLLSYLFFLLAFILPGLDVRLGWSKVPALVSVIAAAGVFLGYMLVFLVFRENRYASRVVEVGESQQVISSGPYALVRHPMYVGTLVMYLLSPLALGSYWAVLPALGLLPVIVARILNEETVLARDLTGYAQYMQKVRWRLIPFIW